MIENALPVQTSLNACIEKTHDRNGGGIKKRVCVYIQQDSKHQQFDLNCIKNQSSSYLTHPKHIILSKAYS